jgi:hypothetical protein
MDPNDWATACALAWMDATLASAFISVCAMPDAARQFLAFRLAGQLSHGVPAARVWDEFDRHILAAYQVAQNAAPRIVVPAVH